MPDVSRPAILVIESDAARNQLLSHTLSGLYEVISASGIRQGLEMAQTAALSLVIAAAGLPRMSAERMIAELRKHAGLTHIPILLVAAKISDRQKIKLLGKGAQDFLMAPFSPTDLLIRIKNLIDLKNSQERYHTFFTSMDQGFCIIEVLFDENKNPIDYRFLETNNAFEKQTGLRDARGKRMRELAPAHEKHWFDIYGKIALTGESMRFENRAAALGRWYEVYAFRISEPQNRQVAIFFNDITQRKQTEERLRRNEEELLALANSIPQLVWMAEPDGNIFWYNQRWYEYTGTTLEQMKGWGWEKVHHPDHIQRVISIWKKALASGEPWEDTFPLRGADGKFRWFLSRAFPLCDEHGNISRWFGTNTDVEEVKHSQEALKEETRVLDLLNKTGTTIASQLDLEALVQTITDAGTELSGAKFGAFFFNTTNEKGESFVLYTLSGLPRSAFDKFGLPRNTPVFNPTFKGEGVVRSADITKDPRYGTMPPHFGIPKGHPPVKSFLSVPVVSRSRVTMGGLFFGHPQPDIFGERSERLIRGLAAQAAIAIDNARLYEATKKAEEGLRQAHEELEMRVAERTAKLSEAVAQMEEFSYTVSHDLRAPLRGMQAYSKILLEECSGILDSRPEAIEYLKRIASNANRLDKMVLDVLTFSRVAREELHLHPVSLDKLVRELVEHYPAMHPPHAEINIEPLADVSGHEPSLTQIISNLLANAIKFVVPGTMPKVRLWTEKRNHEVRIWVEDNGVGIDPKYHHRLFRMFERIHPDFNYEGMGVGLAIVRKAAERMNGTVGVESDGKTGSRFWVQLHEA